MPQLVDGGLSILGLLMLREKGRPGGRRGSVREPFCFCPASCTPKRVCGESAQGNEAELHAQLHLILVHIFPIDDELHASNLGGG